MNKFLSFFIFPILFLFGCERASDFNGIYNQQINFSKNSPNLTDIDTISRSLINLDNKNALKKDLQNLRKFVEKNFQYVEKNFANKVREVYYDKKSKKNIYGKTTDEEKEELKEEGIDLVSIPWVEKDN